MLSHIIAYTLIPVNKSNINETLGDNTSVVPKFVEFYSPYCHHCQNFRPTWLELTNMTEVNQKIQFAEVDCVSDAAICDKYGITGYPTLVWMQPNESIQIHYTGQNLLPNILNFLYRLLSFPINVIDNETVLDDILVNNNKSSIFLLNYNNSDLLLKMKATIRNYRNSSALFYAVESNFTAFKAYRDQNTPIIYNGDWSNESVDIFIQENLNPYLPPLSDEIFSESQDNGTFLIIIFISDMEHYRHFSKVVTTLPSNYSYCYVELTQSTYFSRYMSVSHKNLPSIVMTSVKDHKWRKFQGPFDSKEINNWIKLSWNSKEKWGGPGNGFLSDFWVQVYSLKAEGGIILGFICLLVVLVIGIIVFVIVDMCREFDLIKPAKYE